jgi:hypothetical protein
MQFDELIWLRSPSRGNLQTKSACRSSREIAAHPNLTIVAEPFSTGDYLRPGSRVTRTPELPPVTLLFHTFSSTNGTSTGLLIRPCGCAAPLIPLGMAG